MVLTVNTGMRAQRLVNRAFILVVIWVVVAKSWGKVVNAKARYTGDDADKEAHPSQPLLSKSISQRSLRDGGA